MDKNNLFKQAVIELGLDFDHCYLLPTIELVGREIQIVWLHFYISIYFPKGSVWDQ